MNELKNTEINEQKPLEANGFKEIKPEKPISVSEARAFVDSLFTETKVQEQEKEYFTDYDERMKQTPTDGTWTGERGESKFIPNKETEKGKSAADCLAEKGMDGIEYKNAEPDFSKCAEATVEIPNMTENRYGYFIDSNGLLQKANFTQADEMLAKKWNAESKDGRNDWASTEIRDWRKDNKFIWHECCDTKTMNLVVEPIHRYCTHSGGVAECKKRDGVDDGGDFDE